MIRNWKRQSLRILWLLSVSLLLCSFAEACPTCKEGLANADPNHERLVQGYFWSILFMMSMPFLILGGLSTYFYLEVRKARARQQQDHPAGVPAQLGLVTNPMTTS